MLRRSAESTLVRGKKPPSWTNFGSSRDFPLVRLPVIVGHAPSQLAPGARHSAARCAVVRSSPHIAPSTDKQLDDSLYQEWRSFRLQPNSSGLGERHRRSLQDNDSANVFTRRELSGLPDIWKDELRADQLPSLHGRREAARKADCSPDPLALERGSS